MLHTHAGLIIQLRIHTGLSYKALARRLGVSDTMLRLICNGQRRIGLRTMKRLLAEFPDWEKDILRTVLEEAK